MSAVWEGATGMNSDSASGTQPPEEHIQAARVMGHVIRCTTASGATWDHIGVGHVLPGRFVVVVRSMSGAVGDGKIIPEERVRENIRECQPDVETLPESDSLFGEDTDVED